MSQVTLTMIFLTYKITGLKKTQFVGEYKVVPKC